MLAVDLARQYGVSDDTIRRDLRELAASGLCRRVYGGALSLAPATPPIDQRIADQPLRKSALGACGARLIAETCRKGGVLFLDGGSTNLAIARALPAGLDLTVVTNAPAIAAALMTLPDIRLVVIGGRIDPRLGAALGARALRDLGAIRLDMAFLGTCALDPEGGITATDFEDAELKHAVVEMASMIATAVTNDKLGTSAPFEVGPASLLTHLVVEADAAEPALAPFRELGTAVRMAEPALSR
ncbi:transcriptional regulator, DeoR family [Faunimonas pinastri]|uniref:Transcriptional regulator, DeoR family n=1 Tax=Faunimonas pinastri TaxID=1855383 RepID=A0A1H9C251_9HYPH|nr:transcriptional regulator, DeoR family [Faunimonas pinastri]